MSTRPDGPLSHLTVVDLTRALAGPHAGMMLADQGARVIKVEAPGMGDPMRQWGRGEYPLWWTVCARNKRCHKGPRTGARPCSGVS